VRSILGVGLVIVCLGLLGCSLGNRTGGSKAGGQDKPFTGLANGQGTASLPPASDPNIPPGVDGFLAGQVMNRSSNQRMSSAYIQVVDLQNPRGADAALNVEADNQGFFAIKGLQRGRHYQLIARAREDNRILAGATLATPPDPKLCIYVSEDLAPSNTAPPPGPPPLPGQAAADKGLPGPAGPSASIIGAPIPLPSGPGTALPSVPQPAAGWNIPSTAAGVLPDPTRTAQADPARDGFPRAPEASIPPVKSPEPTLPPPPSSPVPAITPTAPAGETQATPTSWAGEPAHVPSCVLVGRRLENLALYGLEGQAWEYKRNHRGKVILVDFWSTSCRPCLHAIPHLCNLQARYKDYGLEVVGIAYEEGHFAQQVQKIKSVRGRLAMNYLTLVGGGGAGPCPVKTNFEVSFLPTLVLLDERGTIVWRSGPEGLTDEKLRQLEMEIRLRLGLTNWPG